MLSQFKTINPLLPYIIYGLPKTHNPNIPLRPIISNVGAPSYKLTKWLASKLFPSLGKISDSHLQNSDDFVDRCRILNLTGKLLSLDVDSLFTKVPVRETLNFLCRKLPDNSLDIPMEIDDFIDLIDLCITDNVFEYNGNYSVQKYGMSMGSPLSPVLCNIFMEYFETKLLPQIASIKWLRYVDIFLVWPQHLDFDVFLSRLNLLHPTIKFKFEWERDDKLSFLDVIVHKNNGNPLFFIYRMPTNSFAYIQSFSIHRTPFLV